MYCKTCGKEINDQAIICPYCGCATKKKQPEQNDTGTIGWGFLGFFFPLLGLILYLVWKDDKPNTSRIIGKGALIGVIIEVVLGIILGVIYGSMLAALIYY